MSIRPENRQPEIFPISCVCKSLYSGKQRCTSLLVHHVGCANFDMTKASDADEHHFFLHVSKGNADKSSAIVAIAGWLDNDRIVLSCYPAMDPDNIISFEESVWKIMAERSTLSAGTRNNTRSNTPALHEHGTCQHSIGKTCRAIRKVPLRDPWKRRLMHRRRLIRKRQSSKDGVRAEDAASIGHLSSESVVSDISSVWQVCIEEDIAEFFETCGQLDMGSCLEECHAVAVAGFSCERFWDVPVSPERMAVPRSGIAVIDQLDEQLAKAKLGNEQADPSKVKPSVDDWPVQILVGQPEEASLKADHSKKSRHVTHEASNTLSVSISTDPSKVDKVKPSVEDWPVKILIGPSGASLKADHSKKSRHLTLETSATLSVSMDVKTQSKNVNTATLSRIIPAPPPSIESLIEASNVSAAKSGFGSSFELNLPKNTKNANTARILPAPTPSVDKSIEASISTLAGSLRHDNMRGSRSERPNAALQFQNTKNTLSIEYEISSNDSRKLHVATGPKMGKKRNYASSTSSQSSLQAMKDGKQEAGRTSDIEEMVPNYDKSEASRTDPSESMATASSDTVKVTNLEALPSEKTYSKKNSPDQQESRDFKISELNIKNTQTSKLAESLERNSKGPKTPDDIMGKDTEVKLPMPSKGKHKRTSESRIKKSAELGIERTVPKNNPQTGDVWNTPRVYDPLGPFGALLWNKRVRRAFRRMRDSGRNDE